MEFAREGKYLWQTRTTSKFNYQASCNSTRYDISSDLHGKPIRAHKHFLDLAVSGGVKKDASRWSREDARYLGYKFHGLNRSGTSSSVGLSVNLAGFQYLDFGYTFGVSMGPIQAGVRTGITGEIAVNADIKSKLRSHEMTMGVYPSANILGYIKVGASAYSAAEVWAGGNLSFLKYALNSEVEVKVINDKERKVRLRQVTTSITSQLELLSGELYVSAKLLLTSWKHKFIEFWGYKRKRTLLKETKESVIGRQVSRPTRK